MLQKSLEPNIEIQSKPASRDRYKSLLRSLKRTKGFRLLFMESSPAKATEIIGKIKEDLPQKKIGEIKLEASIDKFYDLAEKFVQENDINILFVRGLEHSLYEYERIKREEKDWNSEDIYSYSWKGVPNILNHLNQQRENFRDNFDVCFVFVLPYFAVDYFIRRALDFFDWRSNLYRFPMEEDLLQKESLRVLSEKLYLNDYSALTPNQRREKIMEIQALIDEDKQTPEQKSNLLAREAYLQIADKNYEVAINLCESAIKVNADNYRAWVNRGIVLHKLERYSEAIESYDHAISINPDDYRAWYNRGNVLNKLERYTEALESYDSAISINPDNDHAWMNRGIVLRKLERYSEALESFDRALSINPDDDYAFSSYSFILFMKIFATIYTLGIYISLRLYSKRIEILKVCLDNILEYYKFITKNNKFRFGYLNFLLLYCVIISINFEYFNKIKMIKVVITIIKIIIIILINGILSRLSNETRKT